MAQDTAEAAGAAGAGQGTAAAGQAAGRAKGEIARARDVRFASTNAVLAGLIVGAGAIVSKAALNQFAGGDTGFILLLAAAVLAAWFGGLVGGITAIVVTVTLNALLFLGVGATASRLDFVREIVYVVVGTGTVLLVASRRAARDRLVDALGEVGQLADDLESRDARLELMLAASGTGFWEWNVIDGSLTWSEAIFRQYGLEPAPHAPEFDAYLDMIHPDDRDVFRAAVQAAIDGAGALDLDFRIVWPDGSVHWTHGAGRVLRDEDGRATTMLGTGQDVTERRRLEEQRDQLLVEERRAGEFREAFVDVISHELRTPITTILGLTEILARPGREDDLVSRMGLLEDVRAESERLHRLVEDLLVLSRAERGRLVIETEPLQLLRLLEVVVGHEAADLPSIHVETRIEPDLPVVSGDPTYVEQIVRNLLGNAAKYTPAGTAVVLDARRNGPDVEIRVTDAGPGIPKESLERIFELFYRDPSSARAVSGSGIGLFVCRSLVEAMGGRMWAVRPPGGGSEFGFTLRVLDVEEEDLGDLDVRRPVLPVEPYRGPSR
ncbi:MAG TPA: ATP-binding protein [Methylomirabilota bacterium]|nr:ATP-binding protein [Methylomirabilota bacterium]